jgi:hypothetical protein
LTGGKVKRILSLGLLAVCVFGLPFSVLAQQGGSTASLKMEAIFKSAELPFVKIADDHYKAVVSIDENESDRFQVFLQTIGNDPKDESLQVMQMVFFLGAVPKGSTPPTALIRKINEWNGSLSRGSVFILDTAIIYQSSTWLAKSDATTLINDALVGHFTSQKLRKEIEPYLKQ